MANRLLNKLRSNYKGEEWRENSDGISVFQNTWWQWTPLVVSTGVTQEPRPFEH